MRRYLPLLALLPILSACAAAAVGAATETGVSLAEERSVGTKMDDVAIYTDINRLFLKEKDNELFSSVTVDVRHKRVLLTGAVKSQELAARAVLLAWQARSVSEVINELQIDADYTFTESANDSLIKKNLEGRLLITKDVWVINYSLNVVNGVAYLLGRTADQAEMGRALNIARTTKGVKRVVNYLQLAPTQSATPTNASQAPAPVSTPTYQSPRSTYQAPPPAQATPYYGTPSADSTGYTPESVSSSNLPPSR